MNASTQTATFGAGCFWCTEAIFNDIKGVLRVTSGYSGGTMPNPTYEQVCSGSTGHAEVVNIEFDPSIVSYAQLVEVFFLTHNPTTMNRQGGDIGEQYRSVIFYHDEAQKKDAEEVMKKITDEKVFDDQIITAIKPFEKFYEAEAYHQKYYANNPDQGYCQMVIDPKVAKFRKKFKQLLKSSD